MLDGRFSLGVGTGENLNEHILGGRWLRTDVRLEMLEEAIEVMRLLWEGGTRSHHGKHFTVEKTRVYTLPDEPPDVLSPVSAPGPRSSRVASATATAIRRRDALAPQGVGRWEQARPRGHEGLLERRRGGGAQDRAPALA